jgi:hypothetical protein
MISLGRFSDQAGGSPRGVTVVIAAEPGAGKTFQARTLGPKSVLLDLEGGTLAIRHPVEVNGERYPEFPGLVLSGVETWEEFCRICVLLTGPDPYRRPEETFSNEAYEASKKQYPELLAAFEEADVVFLDSLTWAGRMCFEWAKVQPAAWTMKNNRAVQDTWAVFRIIADEMVRVVRLIQTRGARPNRSIVMTIVMERDREIGWTLQLPGQRAGEELRGVCDTIVALVELAQVAGGYVLASQAPPDAARFRAFVCQKSNPFGIPAKDRSSKLAMLEPARLDQLLNKLGA